MTSSTSEWMNFHHHNNNTTTTTTTDTPLASHVAPSTSSRSPSDLLFWANSPTQPTVVSTGPTTTTTASQLGPEGRVTKPARRRTRASRRTPTTLLNTDTSNFRAMVQQFTGGGPAFSSPPHPHPMHGGGTPFSLLGGFGPGRAQMASGPAFGLLGQQLHQQPLQYAMNNNNNSSNMSNVDNNNNNTNNNNSSNSSSNSLHGMGDLFMGSGENRGNNNGGFQF